MQIEKGIPLPCPFSRMSEARLAFNNLLDSMDKGDSIAIERDNLSRWQSYVSLFHQEINHAKHFYVSQKHMRLWRTE